MRLPRVLLLDELLGALDLKLRKQMQIELKRLQKKLEITFVYVTHDQEEAMTMSDRIAVMTRGDKGSLTFDGKRFVRQGIIPCHITDTMGAGDSFIAGFLTAWLERRPLEECMKKGAENSAVTLGYAGAW